ncbi:MAG: glycoside hydrolase family 97 N-terminal domain-containing protein [Caldilineaceae bacterium]
MMAESDQLRYQISYAGETILRPSLLRITPGAPAIPFRKLAVVEALTVRVSQSYTMPLGEAAVYHDQYNELTVQLRVRHAAAPTDSALSGL